jgi:hypothetical protein
MPCAEPAEVVKSCGPKRDDHSRRKEDLMKVPTWLRASLPTVVRVLLVPMLVVISVGAACGGDDATEGPLESLKPAYFPNGPIDILVGYDAGGGSDQWARSIAKAAEEVLGVQVTVTNLVGNATQPYFAKLINRVYSEGPTATHII